MKKIKDFFKNVINELKKAAAAVKRALTGEEIDETFGSIESSVSVDDGSYSGYDLTQTFSGTDKGDITAGFDNSFDSALEGINIDISEIDKALASI